MAVSIDEVSLVSQSVRKDKSAQVNNKELKLEMISCRIFECNLRNNPKVDS